MGRIRRFRQDLQKVPAERFMSTRLYRNRTPSTVTFRYLPDTLTYNLKETHYT
jgi:hypothetical protein